MNIEKEKRAIQYLRSFEPESEPYYLCYSGGKDSDTIKILAQLAGVKFEAVHNLTTVDAPETVNYIKSQEDVRIDYPELSMWQLIEKKLMPPTRLIRYCCSDLKERGGRGRMKIVGVRWAESKNRAERSDFINIIGTPKTVQKAAREQGVAHRINRQQGMVLNNDNAETRRFVEHCYRTTSTMVNPIVDWTDNDVWAFLHHYGCKSNPLYDCGFKRIGCIGCPMTGKTRKTEFSLYPKYKRNYIKAFERMLLRRAERGLEIPPMWYDGKAVFKWWMEEDPMQLSFLEEDEY